jgi:peptide/nickel transport system substrate-binding protein
MPKANAQRAVGAPLPHPIGSGPFRWNAAERREGALAVFERNLDYVPRAEPPDGLTGKRVVKVDRVEWVIMPDATTAANALVNGEVDFWESASPGLLGYLKQHGLVVHRNNTLPSVAFIRPNFQHKPFDDFRAREALALLIDQPEMMQSFAAEGAWTICHAFTVCGGPFMSKSGTPDPGADPYREPNVAHAKELLAASGYRGETLVSLGTPTLAPINAMTQVLAKRLQEAGVAVDIQMTDFATMLQRINAHPKQGERGDWDLFAYYAVGSSWFHPLMNVSIDLSCAGRNWPGFPCDPEGEALRQDFLNAATPEAETARYAVLEQRLWQVLPYVPAGQFDVVNSYRPALKGVLDAYFLPYWNIEK